MFRWPGSGQGLSPTSQATILMPAIGDGGGRKSDVCNRIIL